MVDNRNTDKSFREKLENFTQQPPPGLWDNIEGRLLAAKRKRRMFYVGWAAAAAVVVIAFLAGWYFSNPSGGLEPVETVQQVTAPETTQSQEITGDQGELIAEDLQGENQPGQLMEETASGTEPAGPRKEGWLASAVSTDNGTEKTTASVSSRISGMDEIKKIAFAFIQKTDWKVLDEILPEEGKVVLDNLDRRLIAENIGKMDSEREKGWIVGMHISPGYSNHVSRHSENYSQYMSSSGSEGSSNIGGGFSVQYKTNKRIRIESGLYFAQNGQRSNNSYDLLAYSNEAFAGGPDGSFAADKAASPSFSNAVNMENGNLALNSYAGVIEMKGAPKGSEIASDFESSQLAFSNRLVSEGEFSQVFDFIEIPLYVRYSVVDARVGVELLGGINAGLVVGNNAYIDNRFGLQNVGKTQDISTVNLSGTVGLGLSYSLNSRLSLGVEPRLSYYMNSINQNPDVSFRPYRLGLYTGIYYEF